MRTGSLGEVESQEMGEEVGEGGFIGDCEEGHVKSWCIEELQKG
jgi:hypothetical protein